MRFAVVVAVWLVVHNYQGLVVEVFGPVDQTIEKCSEYAARATVMSVERGITFECSDRRPPIQALAKERRRS